MSTGIASPPSLPGETPVVAPPTKYETFIDQRLQETRRQVKAVDIGTGLVGLAIGVLAYLFFGTIIDHWLIAGGLGFWGRFLLWTGLVGIAGYYFVRHLLPPLRHRINPVFAASTIEQSQPSLRNSLINFLLLRGRRREMTAPVYEALQQRAASDLSKVRIDVAIDRTYLVRLAGVLAVMLLLLTLYLVFSPKSFLPSAARVLWPWSPVEAPTRVTIRDVKPGNAITFQGSKVTVSAEVNGLRQDEQPELVYNTADKQSVDQIIPMAFDGADRWQCVLPPGELGLQQDYVYYLRAGDYRTANFKIISQITPAIIVDRVTYHYPAYTGLPGRTVERQGDVQALEGTEVTIHATANTDIKPHTAEIDLGCTGRRGVEMKVDGRTTTGHFILRVKRDDPSGSAEYNCYQLRFENAKGEENPRPTRHRIEVTRDLPPEVQVVEPRGDVQVPENGSLMIKVQADDPDFGLRRVVLKFDNAVVPVVSLLEKPKPSQAHAGEFVGAYTFEPAKLGLKAGDQVQFWAEADDNMEPVAHRSSTERQTITVVGNERQRPPENPQGQQGDQQPNPGRQGRQPPPNQPQSKQNDQQPKQNQNDRQPDQGQQNQDGQDGNQQDNADQQQQQNQQQGGDGAGRQKQGAPGQKNSHKPEQEPNGQEQQQEQGQDQQNQQQQGGNQSGAGAQQGSKQQKGNQGKQGGQQQGGQSADRPDDRVDPEAQPGDAIEKINRHAHENGQDQNQNQKQSDQSRENQQSGDDQQQQQQQQNNQEPSQNQQGNRQAQPKQGGNQGDNQKQHDGKPDQAEQQPGGKPDQGENTPGKQEQKQGGKQGDNQKQQDGKPDQAEQQPGGKPDQGENTPGKQEQKQGGGGQQGDQPKQSDERQGGKQGDNQKQQDGKPDQAEQQPGGKPDQGENTPGKQEQKQGGGGQQGDQPKQGDERQGGKQGDNQKQQDGKPDQAEQQPGGKPDQGENTPGKQEQKQGGGGQQGDQPKQGDERQGGKQGDNQKQHDGKPDQAEQQPGGKPDQGENTPGKQEQKQGGGGQQGDQPKQGGKQGQNEKPQNGEEGNQQEPDQRHPDQARGKRPPKDQDLEKQPKGPGKGDPLNPNAPKDQPPPEGSPPPMGDRQPDDASSHRSGSGQKDAGQHSSGKQADGDSGQQNQAGQGDQQAATGGREGQEPTDQRGDGKSSDNRSKDGQEKSAEGNQPNQNGEPRKGEKSPGKQANGKPGKGEGSGANGTLNGGDPGKPGQSPSATPPSESPDTPADQANLDYARRQTQLALEHLREQLAKEKPELLDRLGWTREDARKFLARWEEMQRAAAQRGPAGDHARKEFHDALKSLGLRPPGTELRRGGTPQDKSGNLRDLGRFAPPSGEWADQVRAYNRGISGADRQGK